MHIRVSAVYVHLKRFKQNVIEFCVVDNYVRVVSAKKCANKFGLQVSLNVSKRALRQLAT